MTQCLQQLQSPATRLTRRLTVKHPTGLRARASGAIVKTVNHFQADVLIHYGNQQADAGGIFDILMLCVPGGADVVFEAQGPEAAPVLDAISNLFAADFGLSDN
ncbi:MAG: HPr family phosphocarrier protein [Thermoguttaceae bacterium]